MTVLDSSKPPVAAPDCQVSLEPPANSTRLELRLRTCEGCAVIGVWGELYADSVGKLTQLVDSLIGEGDGNLVLDVSRLYDLDAVAMAELSRLQTALTARRGSFALAAPRPWVRRLLESTCRRGASAVYSTVADAIAQTSARPAAG